MLAALKLLSFASEAYSATAIMFPPIQIEDQNPNLVHNS